MKFGNTLCPYLAMPLKHCSNVNQEHLVPTTKRWFPFMDQCNLVKNTIVRQQKRTRQDR